MSQNPRLIRAARGVERRMFLKALALGLSVPLAAKLARTALAAPAAPPKRFFLYYMPHGIAPEHYNPQVSDSDRTNFALDQSNVSILGPLQKYKDYVNVYQGFKYVGGSTHEGIVNCLSGSPGAPNTTTPRITVDQVIAQGLNAKPLILGACSHIPTNFDLHGQLFWNGTAIEPEKNPAKAMDSLFGNTKTPTVNADVQLRQALLTLTGNEIKDLQSSLGGLTAEQTKLQRHLEAIQGIQAQGGMSNSTCSMAPSIMAVEQVRSASAGQVIDSSGSNDYFYQEKNFPLIFQAQMQLAAQALLCNAAQVVCMMPMYATAEFDFGFALKQLGVPVPSQASHHTGLSHTTPQEANGTSYTDPPSIKNLNPDTRAAFANAQLWFAQQLDKYILSVLMQDDPSAPGTKVLDNTLVYWMSEVGDGANHTTQTGYTQPGQAGVMAYLPLVSIGKAGGALKTGQVLRYGTDMKGADDRPAGDLYATFAQAMGVSGAKFPDGNTLVKEALT